MATQTRKFTLSRALAGGAPDRLRVLIVEDEALIALDTEDALTAAGCEIVGWANRCRNALEIARVKRPDLVIMDIALAGRRDGIEAAHLLRRDYNIPTLFTTSQASDDLIARAAGARPLGWLMKPVARTQLVQAVESVRAVPV